MATDVHLVRLGPNGDKTLTGKVISVEFKEVDLEVIRLLMGYPPMITYEYAPILPPGTDTNARG